MKARFKISLIRPDGPEYHALSNMNQESEEAYGPGLIKVNFNESVPMSTYLTVFIVSDFVSKSAIIEPSVGDNFELRCFSTPAQVDKLDFALQTAVDVIKFYITYFQVYSTIYYITSTFYIIFYIYSIGSLSIAQAGSGCYSRLRLVSVDNLNVIP